MKSILISLFLFFSINKAFSGTCYVKGEIRNSKDSFVIIQKPIMGFFNNTSYEESDTIIISNNIFFTTISCEKPVFVAFIFSGIPVRLIIQPGDSIHFALDLSVKNKKNKVVLELSGANANGQKLFYDYNYWPAEKFQNVWKVLKSDKSLIVSRIKNEIFQQLKPYKNLYEGKQIDKDFYELTSSTITSLLLFESIRKVLDQNIIDLKFSIAQRKQIAHNLFKIYNAKNNSLYYGLNSNLYTKLYLSYIKAQSLNTIAFNNLPDTIVRFENKKFKIIGDFSPLLQETNNKLQEVLFGSQLLSYLTTGGGEILKDEIDYFNIRYPRSLYLKPIAHFQGKINTERYSAKTMTPSFNLVPIILLDSTGKTNDVFSYTNSLQNQITYVDVWATWCGPCIREFKYNFKIDSFLYAYKINRLYVSVDRIQDTIKWKKVISDLRLGGYHIIANEQIQKYLTDRFGLVSNLLAIPVYFIIKDGKIVKENTYPPSDFDKLKDQLLGVMKN